MDQQYIVSARKYRPSTFQSVVGQKALTETLRNAIRTNHLAHAYLFCGPRGVGKTTCARIFAKTINCLNPTEGHDACNECESCRAFNEQRSFNIHELDAASNNSVDDIRTLIEQVRIPPQIGKYSVYIIDEVHMLSAGAFNALLKTLEEPPSYAIFILATTEKHKVLPTILSRCQVYDFSRITISDTIAHLQYVAQQEGITASEEALNVVAQKADGGMRDALSIFDQLVAFCGNDITYEQAINVLNVLDTEYYFRLVDTILSADISSALLLLDEVLGKGFDAGHFVTGFASHLRNVLVSKDPQTVVLIETSDSIRQHYAEQASRCAVSLLMRALDIIGTCDINYRTARNKRLTVELALIKLCGLSMAPQATPQAASAPIQQAAAAPQQAAPVQTAARVVPQSTPGSMRTPSSPAVTRQATPPPVPKPAATAMPTTGGAVPTMGAIPRFGAAGSMPTMSTGGNATPQEGTATQSATNQETKEVKTTPFTIDQLKQAWVGLTQKLAENERIASLLSDAELEIPEPNSIVLHMLNSIQIQSLGEIKSEIRSYLEDKLNNTTFSIRAVVTERKQEWKAYTNREKMQVLIKGNPKLKDLIELLDLQLH